MAELIYLACPYTSPDAGVREQRYWDVTKMAARLMADGSRLVYSPITHSHAMLPFGLPVEFEFWRSHARAMIAACESLWVYCLAGWEHSIGVREEVSISMELGKPVLYLTKKGERFILVDSHHQTMAFITLPKTRQAK